MRHLVSTLFSLMFLIIPAAASAGSWTDLGPHAGRAVSDLILDPTDPAVFYAGTGAGIFVIRDAGSSWTTANEGLLEITRYGAPAHLTDLAVHPDAPEVLFAASDLRCVHKSVDGGAHWRNLCVPFHPQADRVEIAPADPAVLYAYAAGSTYLYRSVDGGESWTRLNQDLDFGGIAGIVLDPHDSHALFLAARTLAPEPEEPAGLLLHTRDGGDSWETIATAPLAPLAETGPSLLAGDPTDPDTLYLGTDAGELFVSDDGGESWDPIRADLPTGAELLVTALVADPAVPERLFASLSPTRDAPGDVEPALFRSLDGGDRWERADSGLPRGHKVSTVVFHPDDPEMLFAPGSAGVFRSRDGGVTWTRAGRPLPTFAADLTLRPDRPRMLYVTSGAAGLYRSENGGATWQTLPVSDSGLPTGVYFLDLELARQDPSTAYVATTDETFFARWFKSEDEGRHWAELGAGREAHLLQNLAVTPTGPPVLLAAGFSGLYRSVDDGATWSTPVADRFASLTVSPSDPLRIYAGVSIPTVVRPGATPVPGVWQSTDAGATWTLGGEGIPRPLSVEVVAEHPDDPSVLLAGLSFRGAGSPFGAVYRSLDRGATWAPFGEGLPGRPITALTFHPLDPRILFAGVEGAGVFWSLDGGATWQPAGRDLRHPWVGSLAVTPDGSALYAATLAGVHRLRLGALSQTPPPDGPWITDPELPGFRLKVRIEPGIGEAFDGVHEPSCVSETVCFSGAIPGRSELFVRIVGPRAHGRLWPSMAKLSTSRIQVWIQQLGSGDLRHYDLTGVEPGSDLLHGRVDRSGFRSQ